MTHYIQPGSTSPLAKRCAIYCRVSSPRQEENSSLDTQEQRCRSYALDHGYNVVAVYREVQTGADLFERRLLSEMRSRVREGDVEVVVAYALDRLSRSQAHLGLLFSECDHAAATIELVSEELDDTPEGQLLQSVRGYVAQIERLKIKERTRRGVQARVASGKPIPGQKAPFGYRWRDERKSGYEIDPLAAAIVRRIFESVLGGSTLRSIANALTAEGIPTPTGRGKRWEVVTLHTILKQLTYTGRAMAFRTRGVPTKGGPTHVERRPESEWVALPDDVAPPIITNVEFEAVQARLEANRLTAPRNNANPEATLLRCGYVRCGYCGYALSITRRKGSDHMYRCHPLNRDRHHENGSSVNMMAPALDSAVWKEISAFMMRDDIMSLALEQRPGAETYKEEIQSLERRLGEITRKRTNIARAVATLDDADAAEPLLAELAALAEQRAVLTTIVARRDRLRSGLLDKPQQHCIHGQAHKNGNAAPAYPGLNSPLVEGWRRDSRSRIVSPTVKLNPVGYSES